MKKESSNKSIHAWVEDIWEEIETQFYGIIGAIFFFFIFYLFFQPDWMKPLIEFFSNNKNSLIALAE
tara:strand:- start:487 stop:687 length:201 start_codon:yes stop_codon:yes gene_type:complete